MNIIVHQIIAILQVLAFGNTICRNQNIYLIRIFRKQQCFILRQRRKAGKHGVKIASQFRNCGPAINRTGNHSCVQTEFFFGISAYMLIKILRCIGKGRKDDNFLVACIQRMLNFIVDEFEQLVQLIILLRRYPLHQCQQLIQALLVTLQAVAPADNIHISQRNRHLFAYVENFLFHIEISAVYIRTCFNLCICQPVLRIAIDFIQNRCNTCPHSCNCQPEGIHRAFHTLQNVYRH